MCQNTGCNDSNCSGCGPWVLPTGQTGPTGATGPQGETGPQGATGPQGPVKNKTDITFCGSYKDAVGSDLILPYSRVVLSTYQLVGHYIYEGNGVWTTPPTKIKIAVNPYSDFTMTADVYVRDLTNSQIIGTAQSVNSNGYQILDLGTLSNLPANPAIFGVYAKVSAEAETNKVDLLALTMY